MVFNEKKMYKDLLTERNTSEKDPRVASQSTPEQQDAAELEFVKLDDVPMKKVRSIPEENEKLRVEPPILQSELRQSTRTTRAPKRYSPALHYLLLIDSDELECYEEALHLKNKATRSVLSIMAVKDVRLEQPNVKTVFFHGDLYEDIYMFQPQGYVMHRKEQLVCKLKKSLYGLK